MKVFISQPMNDKTGEQIKAERDYITDKISAYFRWHDPMNSVEVIDSFVEEAQHDANPLWYLGKSLELLSTADVAVFAKGWRSARGCRIEHEACENYGIEIMEL